MIHGDKLITAHKAVSCVCFHEANCCDGAIPQIQREWVGSQPSFHNYIHKGFRDLSISTA